jgi:cephalosporin-C deacetylase-like acetyl esterase
MDLFQKLLEKYKNKFTSPKEMEDFVRKTIEDFLQISLESSTFIYKQRKVFIQTHPAIKSEIILNKKNLLEKIQEDFPGKVVDFV